MTTEIERAEAAHQAALSSLLFAVESLTPRARRRLRHQLPELNDLLRKVATTRQEFQDAVFVEANARIRADEAESDETICCVQIWDGEEDSGWVWYCFPEVDGLDDRNGFIKLLSSRHNGHALVRAIPLAYVGEVRNVGRDSAFVTACIEWTTENQGQPSWADEMNSPETIEKIVELAGDNEWLQHKVRHYVGTEAVLPTEEQVQGWKQELTDGFERVRATADRIRADG